MAKTTYTLTIELETSLIHRSAQAMLPGIIREFGTIMATKLLVLGAPSAAKITARVCDEGDAFNLNPEREFDLALPYTLEGNDADR
jgi:hypothetical protein